MRESSTLTAKAVPQANGCVRYSSVSGSSSSSWSRNCTLLSFTSSVQRKHILNGHRAEYQIRQPHGLCPANAIPGWYTHWFHRPTPIFLLTCDHRHIGSVDWPPSLQQHRRRRLPWQCLHVAVAVSSYPTTQHACNNDNIIRLRANNVLIFKVLCKTRSFSSRSARQPAGHVVAQILPTCLDSTNTKPRVAFVLYRPSVNFWM